MNVAKWTRKNDFLLFFKLFRQYERGVGMADVMLNVKRKLVKKEEKMTFINQEKFVNENVLKMTVI